MRTFIAALTRWILPNDDTDINDVFWNIELNAENQIRPRQGLPSFYCLFVFYKKQKNFPKKTTKNKKNKKKIKTKKTTKKTTTGGDLGWKGSKCCILYNQSVQDTTKEN